jgi:predicted nucleic acid-binding Zn ribbon protein
MGGSHNRRRGRSRPETLGTLLPRMLTELGLDPASKGVRLLEVWDQALGSEFAPHCRPEGIRHGTLVARVPDSAWMQRLQLEKPKILARLERLLGEPAAEDLRFRVGDVEPLRRGRGEGDRSEPSG